jgi:hypothetical protein
MFLVCNDVWVGMGMHNDSEHLEDDERWQDEHHRFIDILHHQSLLDTASNTATGGEVKPVKVVRITLVLNRYCKIHER